MRKSNKILRMTNMIGLKCAFFFLVFMSATHGLFAYTFSAVAPSGQRLYYNISSGNAYVTYPGSSFIDPYNGYTKPIGSLTIPSTVTYGGNTYSVTGIESHAFDDCSGLTSVTIPNSVTRISDYAFYGCSGLTSVTIPDSVTSIRDFTFCSCSGLTSVTIPNSVTSIGDYAFYGCSGLTSVTIPDSVTSIGDFAFCGCSSLTSVTTGDFVTTIGDYAFFVCSGLISVTIPNSVTSIGDKAFYGCSGLTSIIVSSGNTIYDSRSNCNALIHSASNTLLAGCQNTIIPNSITTIGAEAFALCIGLDSIIIPNSATFIGDRAFYGCSGLTSITIPDSVTSIEDNTFTRCSGLTSVTIGNSVTSINSNAFAYCTGLTTINYNADSCSVIGSISSPFSGDTNLATINFGNNVKIIPAHLCQGLTSLSSVNISNSVTSIGEQAFYACSGLTSVIIPDSVTEIGYDAFRYCTGLTTVNYNAESCTFGGSGFLSAFVGCTNISTINFGNGVTEIPPNLCGGLTGLSSVSIPNSVSTIGSWAFCGCSGLTSVSIGNAVITIGEQAFDGCSGLTSVTIPNSVTYIGYGAFGGCTSLDTVWLLPNEPPSLGSNNTFPSNVNCFFVSCDAYDAYYSYFTNSTGWYSYASRLQIYNLPNFVINVSVNNPTFGTVIIMQQSNHDVSCDSLCIINATSNYGYHFDHWSNGSTANPDTLHIIGDSLIMAYFAPNQYTLVLHSADETLGIVNGGGVYNYHDPATLSATAIAPHYHFESWSDNNTDNPRQVVVVGDMSLTAYFSINVYDVVLEVDSLIHGTVSGDGSYTYGTAATVTATPYSGWEFSHWSDGARYNPYTFAVLQDTVLIACFVPEGSQNGVEDIDTMAAKIYVISDQIVVEGAEGSVVSVYDVFGRMLATRRDDGGLLRFEVPAAGLYLVKVGDAPASRIVVVQRR